MNDRNRPAALDHLKKFTRTITERSVERLQEWAAQVPPQYREAAEQASAATLTWVQALQLARSSHPSVQTLLAKNPAITPDILTELSQSPHPEIRLLVIEHPKCSAEALNSLALDDVPSVARAACSHPNIVSGALAQAAAKPGQFPAVLSTIAQHPAASPSLLLRLTGLESGEVSRAVAAHQMCPPAALAILSRSPDQGTLSVLTSRTDLPPDVQQQLSISVKQGRHAVVDAPPGWLLSLPPQTSSDALDEEVQDMQAALETLNREALEAATARQAANLTSIDSGELRRLRAGHEATILSMKRESLLRLERELGRLRRGAEAQKTGSQREIYRQTDAAFLIRRQEVMARLEQERCERLQVEQESLTVQLRTANEQAQQQALFQTQTSLQDGTVHWRSEMEAALAEQIAELREAHFQKLALLKAAAESNTETRLQVLRQQLQEEQQRQFTEIEHVAQAALARQQEGWRLKMSADEAQVESIERARLADELAEYKRKLAAEQAHTMEVYRVGQQERLAQGVAQLRETLETEQEEQRQQLAAEAAQEQDRRLLALEQAEKAERRQYEAKAALLRRRSAEEFQRASLALKAASELEFETWRAEMQTKWAAQEQAEQRTS